MRKKPGFLGTLRLPVRHFGGVDPERSLWAERPTLRSGGPFRLSGGLAVFNPMRYKPMPYALCPMPYPLCPISSVHHTVTEKGYSTKFFPIAQISNRT